MDSKSIFKVQKSIIIINTFLSAKMIGRLILTLKTYYLTLPHQIRYIWIRIILLKFVKLPEYNFYNCLGCDRRHYLRARRKHLGHLPQATGHTPGAQEGYWQHREFRCTWGKWCPHRWYQVSTIHYIFFRITDHYTFFLLKKLISIKKGLCCSTALVQTNIWHKKCFTNAVLKFWPLNRDNDFSREKKIPKSIMLTDHYVQCI